MDKYGNIKIQGKDISKNLLSKAKEKLSSETRVYQNLEKEFSSSAETRSEVQTEVETGTKATTTTTTTTTATTTTNTKGQ